MSKNAKEKLAGFCSAPWTDAIAYADGALKVCDRCVLSFGNWQKDGLTQVWRGEPLQEFRAEIAAGRYPHEDCKSCHNNGTQRTAASSLRSAYFVHQTHIRKVFGIIPAIEALPRAFFQERRNEESDLLLQAFFVALEELAKRPPEKFPEKASQRSETERAITKLKVIGEALEDFLRGELIPRRVATFRQAQLQAKCTARCIMCAGKFTGEIVDGPTMDSAFMEEAFSAREDITDFWCNGAEYLFFKDWKQVAQMLAQEGVKLRLSTNGILLTHEAIQFIIDEKLLDLLTVSMDAASKEMLESIRVNVKYEALQERLRYLFRYAKEKNYYFQFNAAFVMMRRNLHELPEFVRNIRALAGDDYPFPLIVLCQPLENFSIPNYRRFVHQEHHSILGDDRLRAIFREANAAAEAARVTVRFYNQTLEEFIDDGMKFPAFYPKEMDRELFLESLAALLDREAKELNFTELGGELEPEKLIRERIKKRFNDASGPFKDPIIEKFPELREKAEALVEEKLDLLISVR